MPTLLRLFGLRFFFWSREHKPIHVHVENADGIAKFEIETEVILIENHGLQPKDIKLAESVLEKNRELLLMEWNNYHGKN